MTAARIVGFTSLNLKEFLPLMQGVLDRNVADIPDGANLNPPLHHLLCLAAIKQPSLRATGEACRAQANMFHVICAIACSEYESAEILEIAAMPSILTQTVNRGTDCLLLAGTLEQWVAAVMRGCQLNVSKPARETFNRIYEEFTRIRLAGLFNTESKQQHDKTFILIEHKR